MYGKSRLGQDLFLGEVLVPLREVENTAANHSHDVRRYTLGRRSAKEKVSGEISLECSWRVTPLDVVTLKVCRPWSQMPCGGCWLLALCGSVWRF